MTFLKKHLTNDGVICTLQNGLPELSVASVIGENRTIGCTMNWGATFHGNGVCELTSEPTRETLTFNIGSFGKKEDRYFDYIVMLLETMGNVTIEENFIGARWAKLLVNAAFSGLSVVTGQRFGELSKNRKTRLLALNIMKECIDVAHKANITIEPLQGKNIVSLIYYRSFFKKQFALWIIPIMMKKHKNIRSGMLRDLELGRLTEIDAINGVICQYGDIYDFETPLNDWIVSTVKKIEQGDISPSIENIL